MRRKNTTVDVKYNGETLIESIKFVSSSYSDADTVNFYYGGEKPISFRNSSVKVLDKQLYKCEVIFSEKKISEGLVAPKRKWVFEISEIEVPEKEMMLKIIQQFQKDSARDLLKK